MSVCANANEGLLTMNGELTVDANLAEELYMLHAQLCGALADPHRLMLLYALASRPQTVGELAQAVGLGQPAASRQLKLLRERGLVRAARHGPRVEYRLEDPRLIEAVELLRAVLRNSIARRASLLDNDAGEAAPAPLNSMELP
jgi:DNA-binding transcriptional ArsR family regulator